MVDIGEQREEGKFDIFQCLLDRCDSIYELLQNVELVYKPYQDDVGYSWHTLGL